MRRGVALLLVAGVVGLLGVLSVAFVTLSRLERRASIQRIHATQALLLARSGLEDALARLCAGQDAQERAARYRGEDWDGSGTLTGIEAAAQVVNPLALDRDTCPVRHAMRPSFFARDLATLGADGLPAPLLERVDGRPRGVTGSLGAGRSYGLSLGQEEGIHVNGGDLVQAGTTAGTYDETLKRVLGHLCAGLPPTLTTNDGWALVDSRPAGGWISFAQIRALALGGSQAKLDALRPYLSLHAWTDRKVVRPTIDPAWDPPSTGTAGAQTAGAWAEIRAGTRDSAAGGVPTDEPYSPTGYLMSGFWGVGAPWSGKRSSTVLGRFAPDFERDAAGEVVGRAPVNVNWAKDKPAVLRALLRELSGVFLDSGSDVGGMVDYASNIPPPPWIPSGYLGLLHKVSLSNAEINAVVLRFSAFNGFTAAEQAVYTDWDGTASFDSWDEFNAFLALRCLNSMSGTPEQKSAKLSMLRANFNPNTDLNKFNPGETFYNAVDKSDLLKYSTEFCFRSPHVGASCAGRVLSPDGRVLAERIQSGAFALGQVRLTTQSEFCAGDLGRLDVAGDESSPRRPGDAGFLQACSGTTRAAGSRFPGLGAGAGSPGGASLQSYPEPQWPASLGASPDPAVYDGNLQLATLEASDAGATFLASYDNAYDADAGVSTGMLPDLRHGPVSLSLLEEQSPGGEAEMNMLFPDGCYSEAYRTPRYGAAGNIGDGHMGMLSLWYKPALPPPSQAYDFDSFSMTDYMESVFLRGFTLFDVERLSNAGGGDMQALYLVGLRRQLSLFSDPPLGSNLFFACSKLNNNGLSESEHYGVTLGRQAAPLNAVWRAHRWCHVAFKWWMPAHPDPIPVPPGALSISVNGLQSNLMSFQPTAGILITPTVSMTAPGFRPDGTFGEPWFSLGGGGSNLQIWPSGWTTSYNQLSGSADGTLDEVRFLPAPDLGAASLAVFSGFEYLEGRYVKEDEGKDPLLPEYRSAPLPLGEGARVLRIDWTFVLPRTSGELVTPVVPDAFLNANRALLGTGASLSGGVHAHAELTLMDGSGAALLPGRLSRSGTALSLGVPAGGLRVGVNLCPAMGDNVAPYDKLNMPVTESPVFDDVTITYLPAAGPRLLVWGLDE